jgi:hypothetical protein
MNSKNIESRIKELKEKCEQEFAHYVAYVQRKDDILVTVIKTHLYAESVIDEILRLTLPEPKKITEKTFVHKIDLLEALGLCHDKEIINKLRHLNHIRNKFSHNYNYKLTVQDISTLAKSIPETEKHKSDEKVRYSLGYIMGRLHFVRVFQEVVPFISSCVSNKKIFIRDQFIDYEKISKQIPKDLMGYF